MPTNEDEMIKKLLLLCLLPAIALADNAGFETAIVVGTGQSLGGASRGDSINKGPSDVGPAGIRQAYGFRSPVSCTIDEICMYVSSSTSSPSTTALKIAVYSDASGGPNTSLSSGTADPSTTGFKCSTQSQAVTAGTQYWFVATNEDASPTTKFFSIWQAPENLIQAGAGGRFYSGSNSPARGAAFRRSTDSGGTWTALERSGSAAYRVHCSSGAYYGFPAIGDDTPNNPIASADRVYSTNEVGNKFTTPSNAKLNLRCVSMRMGIAAGTPTGFPRYRLYNGTTLVATTDSPATVASMTQPGSLTQCFSSAQALTAATTYRVVMGETTQSDTSSNAYGPHRIDWDSTTASKALKPFNGTLTKTTCASSCDGGTWTDTDTSWYQMELILEPGSEFATSGSAITYSRGTGGNKQ